MKVYYSCTYNVSIIDSSGELLDHLEYKVNDTIIDNIKFDVIESEIRYGLNISWGKVYLSNLSEVTVSIREWVNYFYIFHDLSLNSLFK